MPIANHGNAEGHKMKVDNVAWNGTYSTASFQIKSQNVESKNEEQNLAIILSGIISRGLQLGQQKTYFHYKNLG